jgi:hypothetical protein
MNVRYPGRLVAALLALAFSTGASADEPGAAAPRDERFAVIAGVQATPLVAILDNSQDRRYPTLDSPWLYGASVAFRLRAAARISVEAGARYEVLRSEGRTLERGIGIPLRLPVLLTGSHRHGFELIPEVSYQYAWSTRADDSTEPEDLRLSGFGIQLAGAFRAELAERLRSRFELGVRAEGGSFVNGHGVFADAGRGRVSVPFGVSLEYGF